MSSRAAGGRKRQLKPLQEQQTQKISEPRAFKSGGFFSRSKITATPALPTPTDTPSPMATFQPAAAYFSPPTPPHLFEVPHSYSYHADPFLRLPPPPAVPAKNIEHQQLALNQARVLQPKTSVAPVPLVKKYTDDHTQIQTPSPPISPMTTANPVQAHSTATYYSPFPAYSQPYSHPQQRGPPPFHSETLFTERDPPSVPALPYHDTSLIHPIGRGPPLVIYTGATSRPTPPGRPITQPQTDNHQKGHPSHSFLHPGYHQVLQDNNTNGAPPSVYPSHTGSNPRSPLRQWTSSSLSLNDPGVRAGHPPTQQTSRPHPAIPPPEPPLFEIQGRPGILARSIASVSTISLQSSNSTNTTTSSTKEGFVFPGSRSTARPKISAKTGTPRRKFKIRSKSKKRVEGDDVDEQSIYQNQNFYSSTTLDLPLSSPRSEPNLFRAAAYTSRPRTDSRVTTQTTFSSISSSTNQSAQGFVGQFPHSHVYASQGPLPGRKKDDVAWVDTDNNGALKPSGFGIRSKKGKGEGNVGHIGRHNIAEASSESLVRTLHEPGPPSEVGGTENGGCYDGNMRDEKVREERGLGKGYLALWPSPPVHMAGLSEGRKQGRKKIQTCPLDPYDSLLLESDRHTSELLGKLNQTNTPSFHNYGNLPPRSVLDLGCGQGHWVLDAAIKWKNYGTRITGFDMVDVMKSVRAQAVNQGVGNNITFVRGNFLEERLPFSDGTFDFIRMSCLSLCIPSDSWEVVLREVFRVLTLGGRLELIDDHAFFPYGRAPPLPDVPTPPSATSASPLVTHRRAWDTYSTCTSDTGATNRSLELALSEDESAMGGLCGLPRWAGVIAPGIRDDDDDKTDTATLHDAFQERKPSVKAAWAHGAFRSAPQSPTMNDWNQHQGTSQHLEALFEHLLIRKYGVHFNLSSSIVTMLKEVFGHAREIATMHLTLAPPDAGTPEGRGKPDANHTVTGAFGDCPGLILSPSTFISMAPTEIEVHALKHPRMLLSCKNNLVKHAIEVTENEEIDEESISEAVWEYENFLHQRFSPPRGSSSKILDTHPSIPQESQLRPSHKSIPSSSGMSTVSEISMDAMWEYQQHLGKHFSWTSDTVDDQDVSPRSPQPGVTSHITPPPPKLASSKAAAQSGTAATSPPYSSMELTPVRTFRVFEAIKLNEMALGPSSNSFF